MKFAHYCEIFLNQTCLAGLLMNCLVTISLEGNKNDMCRAPLNQLSYFVFIRFHITKCYYYNVLMKMRLY